MPLHGVPSQHPPKLTDARSVMVVGPDKSGIQKKLSWPKP